MVLHNVKEETSGDIEAAKILYKNRLGNSTIMDIVISQRDAANELHAEVDELELRLQQEERSVEQATQRLNELQRLHAKLEEMSSSIQDSAQDGPARMIRKGATNKVTRLIQQCQEYMLQNTDDSL